jgi:hypothetical protein
MGDDGEIDQGATASRSSVWLVLTPGREGGVVAAFWERSDAATHSEVLNAANPQARAVLREVVVQGDRRRCRLCGEPVVLDDPGDPMSCIHAEDANDVGDHTAEV